MSKVVAEPTLKKYVAKKKEGDFSLFSNLSLKADKATQTVSKKKLINGIMHSAGFGGHQLGDPLIAMSDNISLLIKRDNKENKIKQQLSDSRLITR